MVDLPVCHIPFLLGGPPVSNIIPEEEEETTEGSSHDATPDPQIPVTMWKDPTVGMTSRGKVGGALQDVVRRTTLPCPVSELADFSLWSLLRKNIGTDNDVVGTLFYLSPVIGTF